MKCAFVAGELGDPPGTEYKAIDSVGIKKVTAVDAVLDRHVLYRLDFEEEIPNANYLLIVKSVDKKQFLAGRGVSVYDDVEIDTQTSKYCTLKAVNGLDRAYIVRILR